MEDEATHHGSAIQVHAAPGVKASWDRPRVEQVLAILLANAVKYGAGQPVRVELSADGDDIAVVVVDRGIGIRAEDQARIFRVFERAVPSQHYGGLGLGLYIAKEIAVAHGGDIGVESRPGEGATFTLRLPRRAPGQSGG
jgi:two-component system, OmpR family, sensor kinase